MEYLYEKLTAYGNSDYYAFHMPGHKRNMELMRARLPYNICLLYTSPSPRDTERSRMPSSA